MVYWDVPYYHATTEDRLPSILRHGLGGVDIGSRVDDCERGVYLASDLELALCVALEYAIRESVRLPSPRTAVAVIRVLVIDDARLDATRLGADPHFDGTGSWLYAGVIDVTGQPILTFDEAKAGCAAFAAEGA